MAPLETIAGQIVHEERKARDLYRALLVTVCLLCIVTLFMSGYIIWGQLQVVRGQNQVTVGFRDTERAVGLMRKEVSDMADEVSSAYLETWTSTIAVNQMSQMLTKYDTNGGERIKQNAQYAKQGKEIADRTHQDIVDLDGNIGQLNAQITQLNSEIAETRRLGVVNRDLGEANRRKLNLIQRRAAPTPRPSPRWFWQR
jgi:hypothetical protein